MSDGTKIPVDWLSTFFAQSSEKVEEFMWGEGANTPANMLDSTNWIGI
jgi:hypothetical protein